ncbi:MAG: molybdopterin-guanine dinucleotide biosynthesis protein MobB, partial [Planctomycetales bacterium]
SEATDDRYAILEPLFDGCDLILAEGHSSTTAPKIEVWRDSMSEPPLAASDSSILAVVTDDDADVSVPLWSRSDVRAITERLLALVND